MTPATLAQTQPNDPTLQAAEALGRAAPYARQFWRLEAEKRRRQADMQRITLARDADQIREQCGRLVNFIGAAWPVIEPTTPYVYGWHHDAISEHLEAVTRGEIQRLQINEPPGCMKAIDDDTPILTTWGWKRHGDLARGDFVFGPDGLPKRVQLITEPKVRPTWAVRFDDGTEVVADGGHLWEIERDVPSVKPRYNRGRKKMVVATTDLRISEPVNSWQKRADRIAVAHPVALPPKRLMIDPYLLGVWLGDGSSDAGSLHIAEQDFGHFGKLGRVGTIYEPEPGGTRRQRFYQLTVEGLSTRLRVLSLLGDKRIPEDYLEAGIEQRWELLRGLMDSDGMCDKSGRCSFTNKSLKLARAVLHLALSLGLKATMTETWSQLKGQTFGPYFLVAFVPRPGSRVFHLERKQARVKGAQNARALNRYVVSVLPAGDRSVRCIQVEGHIYLAGRELVATHNSLIASVLWETWEWGPAGKPGLRYLTTSYKEAYARRDSRKHRDLVQSEWYRTLWPHVVLERDNEVDFENTFKGARRAVPFRSLTAGRGNRLVIDDPHSTEQVEFED